MTEIEVEDNDLGLRIFINGIPDFKLIPKEKFDSFITALELEISNYYNKNKT